MAKYGGRIFHDTTEEQSGNGGSGYDTVMFGGCGIRFGSFQRPVDRRPKPSSFTLLRILGLWRRKEPAGPK
jgi:hypothetical protein